MENNNKHLLDDFELERDQTQIQTSLSKGAKWLAIVSFLIGTCLLLSALFFSYIDELYVFGLMFIIAAFFLNLIVFVVVLFSGVNPHEKSINRKMALKMLLNIPVVISYVWFLFLS